MHNADIAAHTPDRQRAETRHRLIITLGSSVRNSMGKYVSIGILCAALGLVLTAQERIDLSVAETKPSNSQYRIERLTLQSDDPSTSPSDEGVIHIQLIGQNGEPVSCVYNAASSPTGTFLLTALNKSNLSSAYNNNATTGSLRQRIFHRLVVMGESTAVCGKTLTGSLAGSVP